MASMTMQVSFSYITKISKHKSPYVHRRETMKIIASFAILASAVRMIAGEDVIKSHNGKCEWYFESKSPHDITCKQLTSRRLTQTKRSPKTKADTTFEYKRGIIHDGKGKLCVEMETDSYKIAMKACSNMGSQEWLIIPHESQDYVLYQNQGSGRCIQRVGDDYGDLYGVSCNTADGKQLWHKSTFKLYMLS
jgi:Ricin-type beta-trefoil lectin domain